MRLRPSLPLLALLALLSACATSPTGRSQLLIVSPEQAISNSRQAYTEMLKPLEKEGKVNNDQNTLGRVKRITGRIVHQAIQDYPHTKDWAWSVKVVDDPDQVNAWCMPGGKMAIYTGLLQKVDPSDDELAQVMGHEVAHALANHGAEKMSVAMASQLGVIAIRAAAANTRYADLALQGAPLAAALAVNLPNSRTAEREADRIGIELAAKAGYDPRAATTLWEKMGKVGGKSPVEFLSTHPAPENRSQTLSRLAPAMMKHYRDKRPRYVYRFKS